MTQNLPTHKTKKRKRNEKAVKAVKEMDNLILHTIIIEQLVPEKGTKKKVSFASNIKLRIPYTYLLHTLEAGMMCIINGEIFFSSTKNTWIIDLGTLCHITNIRPV